MPVGNPHSSRLVFHLQLNRLPSESPSNPGLEQRSLSFRQELIRAELVFMAVNGCDKRLAVNVGCPPCKPTASLGRVGGLCGESDDDVIGGLPHHTPAFRFGIV